MTEAQAAPISLKSPVSLVRVSDVVKRFGGVRALCGVSLEVHAGQVHALLGENGAGKSTLIKILSGVLSHDEGSIEIDGRSLDFASPAQSREAGIAVVYQDLSLVESLSVGANLMLGREPRTRLGFLKKRQLMRETGAFLKMHGIPLDPRASVGSLPFAYRQMTEIAKALMGNVRLLILDEPTSALTGDEELILFDAIRRVTAQGAGVIYVTHRLGEVFRISDRVTVFRDGANAGTYATAETSMAELVSAIVGTSHTLSKPDRTAVEETAELELSSRAAPGASAVPVLSLSGVGNDKLHDLNLVLRQGEIHGLAGLVGSGRTEILETIFGLRRAETGDVWLDGRRVTMRSSAEAIGLGFALVPEDRHVQGLVLDHSIERNLTLARLPHFSRWGWMRRQACVKQAKAAMRALAVKAQGPSTILKTLSGGNQQKVVFAKWSAPRPKILLLDEPTVGVDVGAREEIYGVVRAAAAAGTGVLIVSSDLTELLLLCDRISIIVAGRIVRTVALSELRGTEDLHHLIQLSQPAEGLLQ